MAKNINKNYPICIVIISMVIMPSTWAQRPSFAGSRPTNGLSQKDKYFSTTPTSANTNTDIQNRFGSADAPVASKPIPFGQTQKPPVGYPVVTPESVYTALQPPSASNNVITPVVFEDRFGEGITNTITSPSSASAANANVPNSSVVPTSTSTQQAAGIPLDAHGDHLLIDQLNRLPIDKRPFWFINYQAIEAQRNGTGNNFAGAQGSRGSFFG